MEVFCDTTLVFCINLKQLFMICYNKKVTQHLWKIEASYCAKNFISITAANKPNKNAIFTAVLQTYPLKFIT